MLLFSSAAACPPGFIKHQDGCYSFKETPKTFTDARKQCQSEGGDLASLIDDRDVEFVTEQMILLGLTGQFWIGYTDAKMDGMTLGFHFTSMCISVVDVDGEQSSVENTSIYVWNIVFVLQDVTCHKLMHGSHVHV